MKTSASFSNFCRFYAKKFPDFFREYIKEINNVFTDILTLLFLEWNGRLMVDEILDFLKRKEIKSRKTAFVFEVPVRIIIIPILLVVLFLGMIFIRPYLEFILWPWEKYLREVLVDAKCEEVDYPKVGDMLFRENDFGQKSKIIIIKHLSPTTACKIYNCEFNFIDNFRVFDVGKSKKGWKRFFGLSSIKSVFEDWERLSQGE